MQYLLTHDEYTALVTTKAERTAKQAEQLQHLCTLAAMHIPIEVPWRYDNAPTPWGCILVAGEQNPGYCDKCPAQEVCPNEHKEWSQ